MGSFSFMKADNMTKVANIVCHEPFKFLIPHSFGGGYIKDYYQDYGYLSIARDSSNPRLFNEPKYDMYELLAVWNHEFLNKYYGEEKVIVTKLPDGTLNMMPEISENTNKNREAGIDLFHSEFYYEPFIYQLKLVSCSYSGDYETLEGVSISDPEQGFTKTLREKNEYRYEHMLNKLAEARKNYRTKYGIDYKLGSSKEEILMEELKRERQIHKERMEKINSNISKLTELIKELESLLEE